MSIEVGVGMERHRFAAAAIALGSLLISGAAHAQELRKETAEITPGDTVVVDEEVDEHGLVHKKREPLFLSLDAVVGFGTYTSVQSAAPMPPAFNSLYVFDTTQIRTQSFMIAAHYRFKKFGVGVRIPFVAGHISDDPALQTFPQDLFTSGNLELSMDMPRRISPTMRYLPEIALSLPTAAGSTPPYSQADLTTNTSGDQVAASALAAKYSQYALGLAAAYARGGEDDALFFNWRLGITPKVAFDMRFGHTKVLAYAKVPIMFALEHFNEANPAQEPVRIEAVVGAKVAQEIGPIQIGVRVVAMVPIATREALNSPLVSIWPEVRLQLTPSAQFWLSGMIPLVGLSNNCTNQNTGAACNTVADGKTGSFQGGLSATF